MASLIPGYEYDIFISYRQKDNKYDGWVTEFVDNLGKELEATFKEDISVYFDINPHDGLLETHDVNASLEDKLKCLVFIPIISRTYCDPKSFAWEHEFKAFVEHASQDKFGLKVKLPNGNVANRVLPVLIHYLDNDDIKLCELVLEGVLRGVEFIYKSPGVNRPLRSVEDRPNDNLNKTYYRDQINKVANSIKEIILCLKFGSEDQIGKQEYSDNELKVYKESVSDSSTNYLIDEITRKSIIGKVTFNKWWVLAIFFLGVLLGIFGLWGLLKPLSDNFSILSTHSIIPAESFLMDGWGQYPQFAISPEGRNIATLSDKGIQLRSLSSFSTRLLEGTEGAVLVVFDADGKSLVFQTLQGLYKIGLSGSTVSLIYSYKPSSEFSLGIDGNFYISSEAGSAGIWRIPASGGEAVQITTVRDSLGENSHHWPQLLPDKKTLLFTSLGPSGGSVDSRIVIQQVNSKVRKTLVDKAIFGYYLSNGDLLYANNDGNIFVVKLDLRKLEIIGEPIAVLSGVNTSTWIGAAFISVSTKGDLLYLPRNSVALNNLDIVDRTGKLIEKDTISQKTLEILGYGWGMPSLSPSGNLIACAGRSYGSSDIWIINLGKDEAERITFDPAEEEFPVWSPDGNTIAYTKALPGSARQILIKDLMPAGKPRLLRTWPSHIHLTSWSPDSKWIAAYNFSSLNGMDCYAIPLDSGECISIANSSANELNGQFSPDGKWVIFQSDESGKDEIYVVSFPKLGNKRQVSVDGGILPRWDHSGKFIYYISGEFMISQEVNTENEFKKGKSVRLFRTNESGRTFLTLTTNLNNFNVSPDGQKFYLVRKNLKRPNVPLHLITNWFQELKEKTVK